MGLKNFWNAATLTLDSLLQFSYTTKFMGRCDPLETDTPSAIRVFPNSLWNPNIYYRLHM
jgi:hypothetical protein